MGIFSGLDDISFPLALFPFLFTFSRRLRTLQKSSVVKFVNFTTCTLCTLVEDKLFTTSFYDQATILRISKFSFYVVFNKIMRETSDLLLVIGQVSHFWFGFEFGKFPLKMSNFFPSDQKNLFGLGQKVLGSKAGWLLIYCGSKVSLGRVRSGPSLPATVPFWLKWNWNCWVINSHKFT